MSSVKTAQREIKRSGPVSASVVEQAPASFVSAVAPVPASPAGAPAYLFVDQIEIDPRIQARAAVNEGAIVDYRDLMLAADGWAAFPPAVVFFDGAVYRLAAGFHRLAAFNAAQLSGAIPVEVRSGDFRDALLFAIADNTDHGVQRTVDDKARAVALLLADPEWGSWSESEIARRAQVSRQFVRKQIELRENAAKIAGSLGATAPAPAVRTYRDRWGNVGAMKTGAIGKSSTASGSTASGKLGGGAVAGDTRPSGAALGRCAYCGRALSDPAHVAAGCGPVCAAKAAAKDNATEDSAAASPAGALVALPLLVWDDLPMPAGAGVLRDRLAGFVFALPLLAASLGDNAAASGWFSLSATLRSMVDRLAASLAPGDSSAWVDQLAVLLDLVDLYEQTTNDGAGAAVARQQAIAVLSVVEA